MSLPYDLDPNSIKPGAMRSMTTDKLASFSLGGTKKTAFERRKEELAAKRREQEAALAAEHARFVEEFESGPERPTKQFVRGGVQGGDVGASSSGRPAAPTGPRISAPQRRGPSAAARAAFQPDAIDGESLDAEPPKPPPSAAGRLAAAPARKGKDRGPSQMEEFMMELRREQEERDSRGERDSDVRKSDAPTSFDNQDPDTTNLYIGNLSPNVSEEALFRSFQHFGAIQSVKIMWPRSEDERLTKRLNGFVAFVKRADAARAKDEMNETELLGYVMRIGWGKTVARPTQPITLASIQARASSAASSLPAPRPTGMAPEAVSVPPNHEIIDRLALFVAQEGHPFEQEVMSREAENPSYRFLYDRGSAEHRYYRWKVVSLCCGDSVDAWDTASFRLQPDGPLWAPPPCSRPPPARDTAAKRDTDANRSRSPSRSPSRSRSRSRSPPRSRSRSRSRSPPARGRKFDRDNHARGLE
ncbi:hypothetical protein EMIHUDRAFT_437368, partial [Emiliania huxleyi CCMP1516]|uniref:RRM domain-containing protein n=2 Tax=Emiliania huxleyi TaxID=2903 RepID=A0A0D3IMD9_EMIH1